MEPKDTPDRELTLDEWVERHAERLADDIAVNLEVWGVDDAEGLHRMIMTSVRNEWPLRISDSGKPLPNRPGRLYRQT